MAFNLDELASLSKIEWQCSSCNQHKAVRVQTLKGLKVAGREWRCASCARKDALSSKKSSFIACRLGSRHSEESKRKIAETRIKRLGSGEIDVQENTFYAKQYIITHPETEDPIVVQGSYELAYACHLLVNKVDFCAHPKPLPYFDGEHVRNYFPDFYIPEFELYVEIKSDYTLSLPGVKQKYAAVKELGHNLLVLSNSQLEKLGVLCRKNSC